jgi:phosphatidylinositol alpha 1,6-mannosyltransferase
VVIVAESFAPSVNGVARSVRMVADRLVGLGHQVVVLAPARTARDPGRSASDRRAAVVEDVDHRVQVLRVPSLPVPFADLPVGLPGPSLRETLRILAPDVVHLASPVVLGGRAAALARQLGLPTVGVYQTDLAGFARAYGFTAAHGPLWRYLRWVHRQVDRTLAPSNATVADLRRQGVADVHRWVRGVDTVLFRPAARRRPPTGSVDRVHVGYVGRLAPEKRVERLALLADLPGVQLVVVGDGPQRRRLEALLPGATFTGRLGGQELARAYADLDVFVHPGEHETYCQAAQEALASGVPVVGPSAGGLIDLIDHGRTGLRWRPDRPDAMRDAVAALAGAPGTRRRYGLLARQQVRSRDWATITEELVGHYHAVRDVHARRTA